MDKLYVAPSLVERAKILFPEYEIISLNYIVDDSSSWFIKKEVKND